MLVRLAVRSSLPPALYVTTLTTCDTIVSFSLPIGIQVLLFALAIWIWIEESGATRAIIAIAVIAAEGFIISTLRRLMSFLEAATTYKARMTDVTGALHVVPRNTASFTTDTLPWDSDTSTDMPQSKPATDLSHSSTNHTEISILANQLVSINATTPNSRRKT